ncbi:MAG: D-glycero-alpha-D-manno-heptose-1,7-bisphosphate 7-phosphatase [Syntrophobacteraceae bacterium]
MLAWFGSPKPECGRFILLDRDGVINVNGPDYIKSLAEVVFYEDALEALKILEQKGVGAILVSNQSGINRGLIAWEDFRQIHEGVIRRVEECGGRIHAAFYCPHRPDENCGCRKPAPGMIFSACRFAGIEPGQTFFVGDSQSDMLAAQNAGCPGVRLLRAQGEAADRSSSSELVFQTLLGAVLSIYGKDI